MTTDRFPVPTGRTRILLWSLFFLSFFLICSQKLKDVYRSNIPKTWYNGPSSPKTTASSDIPRDNTKRVLQGTNTSEFRFSRCGLDSTRNFKTWFQTLNTDAPVLFPKSDDHLYYLVTKASSNGCKVRIRGAGHSEDGLVAQSFEDDVVVISLKDYYPPKGSFWHGIISDNGTPTVRMRAGASFLELMSLIKPQGYLLRSGTIGRFFTLGGVYLNPSCIGNIYDESRLATHLRAVRVMDGFGKIRDYSGDDVLDFRGSMGLLGVVTAVEIEIRRDTGIIMDRQSLWMSNLGTFERDRARDFFRNMLTNNDGTTFMFWSHSDEIMALNTRFSGGKINYDRDATQDWYITDMAKTPDLAYDGGTFWILPNAIDSFSGLLEVFASGGNVRAMRAQQNLRDKLVKEFDVAKWRPNDGFIFYPTIPNYEQVYYAIRCKDEQCLSDMVDVLGVTRAFLRKVHQNPRRLWIGEQLMWRIFNVQEGDMTLEHMQPGRYIGIELHVSRSWNRHVYDQDLERLDRLWQESFPDGAIHHGKAYAYGTMERANGRSDGMAYPFQNDAVLDSIYSDDVRWKFVAKMDMYDPSQVFRAGSALRLLGLTDKKYLSS